MRNLLNSLLASVAFLLSFASSTFAQTILEVTAYVIPHAINSVASTACPGNDVLFPQTLFTTTYSGAVQNSPFPGLTPQVLATLPNDEYLICLQLVENGGSPVYSFAGSVGAEMFTVDIVPSEPPAAPTAIASGFFKEPQNIAISTETAGSSIYYTIDGSEPTTSSTLYVNPVFIAAPTVLKFIATKAGLSSATVSRDYMVIVSLHDYQPFADNGASMDVTELGNGNIVVRRQYADVGGVFNAGSVTLYNGITGAKISELLGSSASDNVGSGQIIALSNGNFVVSSPNWDNGLASNAGAVTWCSGTTGCDFEVSPFNSLVGSTASDSSTSGVNGLPSGNYVVRNQNWDNRTIVNNAAIVNAGAITLCSGTTGCAGPISTSNSYVGSTANDQVGSGPFATLTNGNVVFSTVLWDNGEIADVGAVRWCPWNGSCTGPATIFNSLIGSQARDLVGSGSATALTNGNYVVRSASWNNGAIATAGAVTWCDGTTGCVGAVSSSNSLVGSETTNEVGLRGIMALTNGNYVVRSHVWDNGGVSDVGAATWCDGSTAGVRCTGAVSSSNSLVGSASGDSIGNNGWALANGNYLIGASSWDNESTNVGSVTWCSGTSGCVGAVSTSNSIYGTTTDDRVGLAGVIPLPNSNYVIASDSWDNVGTVNIGAVTFCNSPTGCVGPVSLTNSLIGSTANDSIGSGGVIALSNGNFVVSSPNWYNGLVSNAAAVTFCDGSTGCVNTVVSPSNSLVGSATNDNVGAQGITVLTNGRYLVRSRFWDNGATIDAGALTWCNGTTGCVGLVSDTNSLVGTTQGDFSVGVVSVLTNGNYVVRNNFWNNGTIVDAGAVTWCDGATGCVGYISSSRSLVGSSTSDRVGELITTLNNGNYVVRSHNWDDGLLTSNAGAVTWCDGTIGCTGAVSSSNSLVGMTANDALSSGGIIGLASGNYFVISITWSSPSYASLGLVFVASGTKSSFGAIPTN